MISRDLGVNGRGYCCCLERRRAGEMYSFVRCCSTTAVLNLGNGLWTFGLIEMESF